MKISKKRYAKFIVINITILLLGCVIMFFGGCISFSMPGKSFKGKLPSLTGDEKDLSIELKKHVEHFADQIGERNFEEYDGMLKSIEYIERQFKKSNYNVERNSYNLKSGFLGSSESAAIFENQDYVNIIAELPGTSKKDEIVIIGAHYDSVALPGCRAANDNASGVAAVLALARRFAKSPQKRTIRFIAFTNEEPPFFQTHAMGSMVYANKCAKDQDKIIAMITPETIGCYSDKNNSQNYPFPLDMIYPSTGNFIAFVGDSTSYSLTRHCVEVFRKNTKFPSEGAVLPSTIVPQVNFSDHWAFSEIGCPALMVTDTAMFRYPHYHTFSDDSNQLDYDSMARVVIGLEFVLRSLANDWED